MTSNSPTQTRGIQSLTFVQVMSVTSAILLAVVLVSAEPEPPRFRGGSYGAPSEVEEAPYAPSGWRPSGRQFLLPIRQTYYAPPAAYGTPTTEQATTTTEQPTTTEVPDTTEVRQGLWSYSGFLFLLSRGQITDSINSRSWFDSPSTHKHNAKSIGHTGKTPNSNLDLGTWLVATSTSVRDPLGRISGRPAGKYPE